MVSRRHCRESDVDFEGQSFVLYDVAILRENPDAPIIVRVAYPAQHPQFDIGQYIRGNIWLQFAIDAVK